MAIRVTIVAFGLMLTGQALTGEDQDTRGSVQALRYGVTLYHYFQQDYFAALTELMVARERHQLGPHADGAELLRGGIALSFGMTDEAETVFQQQLQDATARVDRNRAWFYLAKIAWQREDLPRVEHFLGKMEADYSGELRPEAQYLNASLALARERFDQALAIEKRMPSTSPWQPYLRYNLGVAEVARGNWEQAGTWFRALNERENPSAEIKALGDMGWTAAGFAALAAGDSERAMADFRQVRLHSPYNQQALLGYGRALAAGGDYQRALTPWHNLASRSAVFPAVRQALLAVPVAYLHLGEQQQALLAYQQAVSAYRGQQQRIQSALTSVARGQSLLDVEKPMLLDSSPHGDLLQPLLASEVFQVGLSQVRDLRFLNKNLSAMQSRLEVLQQADAERQANWAGFIEGDGPRQLESRHGDLQERAGELRLLYRRALESQDDAVFASPDRVAQWRQLDRAAALASRSEAGEDVNRRLRLIRGLLSWDDNEQFPARRWRLSKQLAALAQQLGENDKAVNDLSQLIASRRQSDFQPRITTLKRRGLNIGQRVTTAGVEAEAAVEQLVVTALEQQLVALKDLLSRSQLALARIYDHGLPGPSP